MAGDPACGNPEPEPRAALSLGPAGWNQALLVWYDKEVCLACVHNRKCVETQENPINGFFFSSITVIFSYL